MAHLKMIVIAAIVTCIVGVSLTATAQAENRHGTMPSRMVMKKHTMKHRMMRHHSMPRHRI